MAKRFFTDESLATFVDETKTYANNAVAELSSVVVYASDSNENISTETDGILASEVSYVNTTSGLSSTNVQAAINELSEETSQLSSEIVDQTNRIIGLGNTVTYYGNQIDNKISDDKITQEAGESETLVMSQKAVTTLVNTALGKPEAIEYETVDSVDKMTDTSKQYILNSTGTLWAYGEVTVEKEPENKFDSSKAELNKRFSLSSNSTSASNGYFVTDYIEVPNFQSITPYNVHLNWELSAMTVKDDCKIVYFDSSKTKLGGNFINSTSGISIGNGETVIDIKTMSDGAGTVEPDITKVTFIRLQLCIDSSSTALTSADIANCKITLDAEGSTITGYQWYDTEIIPSTDGGAENYVDMLVKVNKNKNDIAELSSRIAILETGSNSVAIPSFWQIAVNECIAKIKALQIGRNCITFPFFSDNHQRNGYVGILIAHIMKECGIPYAFFGGDTIDNGYLTENTMITQDKAFDTIMAYIPEGRFCRAVGNHDGYWNDNGIKGCYTRAQVYELFLREEGLTQNKHFGEDGTYYYIDDIASKVRFIILNTNSETISAGSESIDSTQLSWLQNTALSFDETGWGVVVISHCPISNHYHANVTNAEEVVSVVNRADVDIIGWFSGHIHRDRMYTHLAVGSADGIEGTNGIELGFTQVTITSDHTSISYDDATKHTVANDDKSHAIDFVTVNKATRTVNITRLGIGNDRSYTY